MSQESQNRLKAWAAGKTTYDRFDIRGVSARKIAELGLYLITVTIGRMQEATGSEIYAFVSQRFGRLAETNSQLYKGIRDNPSVSKSKDGFFLKRGAEAKTKAMLDQWEASMQAKSQPDTAPIPAADGSPSEGVE